MKPAVNIENPPPARLIIPATISLAIGIYFADRFKPAPAPIILVLIAVIIASLVAFARKRTDITILGAILTFFLMGSISFLLRENAMERAEIPDIFREQPVYITARITEPTGIVNGRTVINGIILKINKDNSFEKKKIRAIMRVKDRGIPLPGKPGPGCRISFTGIIHEKDAEQCPWEFDYEQYLKHNGISASISILSPGKMRIRQGRLDPFRSFVFAIKERMMENISRQLPSPVCNIIIGIVFGQSRYLPEDTRDAFQRTGTTHLLAASGMNVTIIAVFFMAIFSSLRIEKKTGYLLTIIPTVFYVFLAGETPPIVRSAVMGVIFLIAMAFDRDHDPLRSLFISAFIMLLFNPYNLFLASFLMSFMSVAGILLIYPHVYRFAPFPWKNKSQNNITEKIRLFLSDIHSGLLLTMVSSVSLFPVLAGYFNKLPMLTIPANLIAVPICSILLPAGLCAGFLGLVFNPLGWIILVPTGWLTGIMLTAINFFSDMSFSSLPVPSPGPAFFIPYYSFLVILTVPAEDTFIHRRRREILSIMLIISSALLFSGARNLQKCHRALILRNGHCRAILINRWQENVLIMESSGGKSRRGQKQVLRKIRSFCEKNGIRNLRALIIMGDMNLEPDDLSERICIDNIFSYRLPNCSFPLQAGYFPADRKYTISISDPRGHGREIKISPERRGISEFTYRWQRGKLQMNEKILISCERDNKGTGLDLSGNGFIILNLAGGKEFSTQNN